MYLYIRTTVLATVVASSVHAAAPQSVFIASLIENAQAKIKKSPAVADGYGDLAFALSRRARETEDPLYWKLAEQAIATALKWDPTNFEARKARVIIRIQQGRFADANEEAVALNKRTPDDNLMYGLLADIALAQGRYPDAEARTQRMIDLRQVNGPGLERAARVREIIGFPDGAIEFWISALRLASSADTEERAYVLTQLAGLSRRLGKLEDAAKSVTEALTLEPGYPAALLEQARIALSRQKPEEALAALTQRLAESDNAEAHYWKFKALIALNRAPEARIESELFAASAPHDGLFIRFLIEQGSSSQAVEAGRAAVAQTPTADAHDAYALALLSAGQAAAANEQIELALAPGIKNPAYFLDAARIRKQLHDPAGTMSYLKKCIEVNATSPEAALAFAELQKPANVP